MLGSLTAVVNPPRMLLGSLTAVVNPSRMRRRVTVVGSVSVSVTSNLTSGAYVHPENTVTYSAGKGGQNICVGFSLKLLCCRDPALLR